MALVFESLHLSTNYLLLLAGVLGHVAFEQLLSARFDRNASQPVWLCSFCAGGMIFILGRWLQFSTSDVSLAELGERVQLGAGALLTGLAVGIAELSGARRRASPQMVGWAIAGGALGLLTLVKPQVSIAPPDVRVDLLGRSYLDQPPGPLHLLVLAYCGVGIVLAGRGLLRSAAASTPERRKWFIVSGCVLAPLAINEVLDAAHIVGTATLFEIGLVYAAVAIHVMTSTRLRAAAVAREASERTEHKLKELVERELRDEQREQLRTRFVEEVLTAQEEERRRIARELHDEAGQSLTRVLLGLRELMQADVPSAVRNRIAMLHEVAQLTLDELGRLARGLHPQLLEHLGFAAAVERFAAELGEQHEIEVDVEVIDREPTAMPPPVATALYRVVQEALTNAIRHGRADSISLIVRRDGHGTRITIEDDGCGFDPDVRSTASTEHGLGLHGVRERLALLGGTLEIESAPGAGTTLIAVVPAVPTAAA
jgi:signal transduction histidine kinase